LKVAYIVQRVALLVGVIMLSFTSWAPVQVLAQSQERCFAETGYCISGPIRSYWERNGGLSVFGYPISSLMTESVEGQALPVQWFQRDRLENHGSERVMAGRLGAQLLETMGRRWQPRVPSEMRDGCRTFPETGYAVCEPFLSYWERNGGLARFGYPLSSVEEQIIGDWVGDVQYFERRRMEHHTELAGTPFTILLGLLGQTIRNVAAADACAQPMYGQWRAAFTSLSFGGELGCPLPAKEAVPMAIQPFEAGQMIWVNLGAGGRQIIVELRGRAEPSSPRGALYVAMVFEDTWEEGQPIDSGMTPPAGRLEPQRGFGKLWRERPLVRQSLGWATAPEQLAQGTYQSWTSGGAMMSAPDVSDAHRGFFFVRAFLFNSHDQLVRQ
jgi:hypothetical protein